MEEIQQEPERQEDPGSASGHHSPAVDQRQRRRRLTRAEDEQEIKVPQSGGRVEKLRVHSAGDPVNVLTGQRSAQPLAADFRAETLLSFYQQDLAHQSLL